MVARLALVCAIEAALVVVLAMAVFGADQPDRSTSTRSEVPASRRARSVDAAASEVATQKPATGAPTAASRTEVMAKVREDDLLGVLLTGSMRLRDGSPADAGITLSFEREQQHGATAADGSYAVVGLHRGEWKVALAGTFVVATEETLAITDDPVQRHDFVLDASFPVRVLIVTPDGQDGTRAMRLALRGWTTFFVVGQRERFPSEFAPTGYGAVFAGDATWDGEMNPRDGVAGTVHLASMPAHVALLQQQTVLEQQLVQPGQQEVKFVVDVEELKKVAASASVRVLDADSGEPLVKARVVLNTLNRGSLGQAVDAEGRTIVEGLPPGLLRCEILASGHESMSTVLRVQSGQRLELGDVRLGPLQHCTGTVLDTEGKPASVTVTWHELKWHSTPIAFLSSRSVRSEADGTFVLPGAGRGAIAITAWGEGCMAAAVFDNPPPGPVVLRLVPQAVCNVTRSPDPAHVYTVTLFDGQRRAITARTFTSQQTKASMSMPAGNYAFEVHDEQDRLVQSGSLTFGPTPCMLEIR